MLSRPRLLSCGMGVTDASGWSAPDPLATQSGASGPPTAQPMTLATLSACRLAYCSKPFRESVASKLSEWPETPLRTTQGLDDMAVLRSIEHADALHRQYFRIAAPAVLVGAVLSVATGGIGFLLYVTLMIAWWAWGSACQMSWRARGASRSWSPVARLYAAALPTLAIVVLLVAGWPNSAFSLALGSLAYISVAVGVALTTSQQAGERLHALVHGPPTDVDVATGAVGDALDWSRAAMEANVEFYSAYAPFKPDIDPSRSWNLTVDLGQPARGNAPVARISPSHLTQLLSARLRNVGLRAMTVHQVVYAHVRVASELDGLVAGPGGRLIPVIPSDVLSHVEAGLVRTARSYLRLTVGGPQGTPALSSFVRVAIDGETLYLETFHSPGRWIRTKAIDDEIAAAGYARPRATAIALALVPDMLRACYRAIATKRAGPPRGTLPLGSSRVWSLFDLMPQSGPPTYFDEADLKSYIEMIDRQVLTSIGHVLSTANVDTSEFSSRTVQIFHNSTIVSNNTLVASALAAGGSDSEATVG